MYIEISKRHEIPKIGDKDTLEKYRSTKQKTIFETSLFELNRAYEFSLKNPGLNFLSNVSIVNTDEGLASYPELLKFLKSEQGSMSDASHLNDFSKFALILHTPQI